MEHDITLSGRGFRLRPLGLDDSSYVVALRASSSGYLNRGAQTEVEQRAWTQSYLARKNDYCFIVERIDNAQPQGLVGVYAVDHAGHAEWGRLVLQAGSVAAIETALLIHRCGFEMLGLARMVCHTLLANGKVIAFHDSCGLSRAPNTVMITHDGVHCEAVEHALDAAEWPAVAARLERLAGRVALAMRHQPAPCREGMGTFATSASRGHVGAGAKPGATAPDSTER